MSEPTPMGQGVPGAFVVTGRVLGCEADGRPRVRLLSREAQLVTASWALPYAYRPEPGDLLLVIGRGDQHYVIGVVRGSGSSLLAARGDLALESSGALSLAADEGIRMQSPCLTLRAQELETHASDLVHRSDRSESTVREVVEERAGQCSRAIDGEDCQVAGSHSTLARGAAKIDGEQLILS